MTQAITDPKQASAALEELFGTHKRVVFFGGAGVSTASGIPDFQRRRPVSPAVCLSARDHALA